MKKLIVFFSFIFLIWFSSAYAPRRAEWNCSTNDDEEMKSACEIEKQFFKFTETTWTRVMSTTCCTYEEHQPEFYYYFHNMRDVWEIESWNVKKLDELVLKLTSQIYSQSKNKLRTLNILSWLSARENIVGKFSWKESPLYKCNALGWTFSKTIETFTSQLISGLVLEERIR